MSSRSITTPAKWHTVLFDLGGVLAPDVWETILLTPKLGLADSLGLDPAAVRSAAEALWDRYARIEASEADYWRELGKLLGVEIPGSRVRDSYGLLVANPAAGPALRRLARHKVAIGIISNNTTFWIERQLRLLPEIRALADPALWFVSCWCETTKRDSPGLFGVAARRVSPSATLVVDDRASAIDAAKRHGFHTYQYRAPSPDLTPPPA